MAVIGDERIDFVVVQFANGVAEEDCQEVALEVGGNREGMSVMVGDPVDGSSGKSRL